MSYVVHVETDDGQRLYLRRVHAGNPILTTRRERARRFATKAHARAAIVKTGLNRRTGPGRPS